MIELDPETAAAQKTVLLAQAKAIQDEQEADAVFATRIEQGQRESEKLLAVGCWVVAIIVAIIIVLVVWFYNLAENQSTTAIATQEPEQKDATGDGYDYALKPYPTDRKAMLVNNEMDNRNTHHSCYRNDCRSVFYGERSAVSCRSIV